MFVDFAGDTIDIFDPITGEVRAMKLFVAAMGASNYTYAEATRTQQVPDWIASHTRAFAFAALLTLVGYSNNDTIVVFDRIRENIKLMRREKLADIVNKSINQTLSRTILTSGTVAIVLVALATLLLLGEPGIGPLHRDRQHDPVGERDAADSDDRDAHGLRDFGDGSVGISLDETTTRDDIGLNWWGVPVLRTFSAATLAAIPAPIAATARIRGTPAS